MTSVHSKKQTNRCSLTLEGTARPCRETARWAVFEAFLGFAGLGSGWNGCALRRGDLFFGRRGRGGEGKEGKKEEGKEGKKEEGEEGKEGEKGEEGEEGGKGDMEPFDLRFDLFP